jgi:hypothetical protein
VAGGADEMQEHLVEGGTLDAGTGTATPAASSLRTTAGRVTAVPTTATPIRRRSGSTSGSDPTHPSSTAAAEARSSSPATTTSTRTPHGRLERVRLPVATARPASTITMSSASRSASSRYWVVSSTVVPAATSRSQTVDQISVRLRGSRLVVSSSRNSTGGATTLAIRSRPSTHTARPGPDQTGRRRRRGRTGRAAPPRGRAHRVGRGGASGREPPGSRGR